MKENDKVGKQSPLALEVRRMHGVDTRVVPVVVGSLGVSCEESLKKRKLYYYYSNFKTRKLEF